MLSVKVRCRYSRDEELRAICACGCDELYVNEVACDARHTRSSVGHTQEEWLLVLKLKVLVFELFTIDALTTSTIASGEVTTLDHERLDHSVKARAFVVKWFPRLAVALLASAQSAEVVGGFWYDWLMLKGRDRAGAVRLRTIIVLKLVSGMRETYMARIDIPARKQLCQLHSYQLRCQRRHDCAERTPSFHTIDGSEEYNLVTTICVVGS